MRYQYDRLHKEDVQICFVRFVRVLGVIVFGLLVAHLPVEAQWRMKGPFNRFSLEVQTGADFPIWLMTINDQNVKTGELQDPLKHVGVPNFQAGLRYMFTDWVGVRPFYAQHRFQHTIDSTGLKSRYKMQLFGLEGVLNLAEVLPAGGYRNPRKWNVLLHVGAGLASEFAKQNTITHLSRSRLAMGMGGI